jgi:hypothetical protein
MYGLRKRLPWGPTRYSTDSKEREDDDGEESEEEGEQEEGRAGAQEEENVEGIGAKGHKEGGKARGTEAQSRPEKGAGSGSRACTGTRSVLAGSRKPRRGQRREQLTVFRSYQGVNGETPRHEPRRQRRFGRGKAAGPIASTAQDQ